MKPEEIQKLLGGYATGTLTPEEQQALFAAALEDQGLFDALAKEQPLRELLRDPAARAQVLASIEDRPRPWWRFGNRWVMAGGLMAACLAVAAGVYFSRPKPAAVRLTLMAELKALPAQELRLQAAPVAATPVAVPAEAPVPKKAKPAPVRQEAEPLVSRRDASASATKTGDVAPAKVGVAPSPAATPPTAPAPVPTTAQTIAVEAQPTELAVNGSVSGALPVQQAQNARALFYAPPGVAGSQFLPSGQNGPVQSQTQQAPSAQVQTGEQSAGQALPMNGRTAALLGGLAAVPNPGVKWTALRRGPDGLFDQVDREQIHAGDVIKLRLVPNDNGFLSVIDGNKTLVANQRAVRLAPFETPEITSGHGQKELTVVLSRQPQVQAAAKDAKAKKQERAANLVRAAATAGDQLSESDRAEHAVYEVKTGSNLITPVLVRITLNFQ